MTSDEAEAYSWLEKEFWANFISATLVFCWIPRRNYNTGRLMWLRFAVQVNSRDHFDSGSLLAIPMPIRVRWYTPTDYTAIWLTL